MPAIPTIENQRQDMSSPIEVEAKECTTLSTTESECIAASEAAKEAIWLQRLSVDFSAKSQIDHPTLTLYCDSHSAICLIRKPVYHAKTKHNEVRYHHIQELIINKKLEVRKVDTEVNIANSMTKPLPDHRFGALRRRMGLQQVEEHNAAESREATRESEIGRAL